MKREFIFSAGVRRPWLVIVSALLMVILCGAGLKNFKIDSDYEVFFDGENPRLQAHQALEAEYGRKDAVRIGFAPVDGNVFTPATLAAIAELTEAGWTIPYSSRSESLTNFQYLRSQDGDLISSDLFQDPLDLSPAEIEERKRFALSDPSIINYYVNPQGSVAGLQILISIDETDPDATAAVSRHTKALVADFRARYPDINVYVTGSIMTNDAFLTASTHETGRLLLLLFGAGLLLYAILVRTIAILLIGACLKICAIVIGLGLASWIGIPFTAFSPIAIIVTLAVVIASSVHLLIAFKQELVLGKPKPDAIQQALTENCTPMLLTTLTTAAGLLCLNFSDIPPNRYLGTTAAFAVLGTLFLNYSILPALLQVLPTGGNNSATPINTNPAVWDRFSQFVISNKAASAGFVVVVFLLTAPFITHNRISDSVLNYFDERVEFRRDSDFLMENLFYFYSMDISISAGRENGINDPAYMRNLDALVAWANSQPEVYTVLSFTNILKNLNRAVHDGRDDAYQLPDDPGLAAEYMLLYEMSAPFGLDLSNQLNVDRSAAKVIIGFREVSGDQLIAFDRRIQDWMSENFPPEMQSIPAGPSLMFANIWMDAAISNIKGMLLAILLVSIILTVGLQSIKLGLICILPNLMPALMAFGVWGLIDGSIDMGASAVAIVAFGIVVDDSIHFISKFQYALNRLGYVAEDAVGYAMRTVGRAISISTVILFASFFILAQSYFALNAKVGIITCILLIFALLVDLILLPIMLLFISKSRRSVSSLAPQASPS